MTTEPGGAPMIRPTASPTVTGIAHQPSAQARTPRAAQVSVYSCRLRRRARAAWRPSEWLTRYVVLSRMGNSARQARSGSGPLTDAPRPGGHGAAGRCGSAGSAPPSPASLPPRGGRPPGPPPDPRSITWSAVFTTSRLCSMSTTVLPASTRRPSTWRSFGDVVEVQARGRLVEDVEGAAGLAPGQLAGQLHALRLPAGERGRALPQAEVAQAHVHEGAQEAVQAGVRHQHGLRLRHREVQDVGHCAALVQDLEGLAVVAASPAGLAAHVHVGEEVHADGPHAVALAGLAAPALHVEGEAAGLVAAGPGLGHQAEQLADEREGARVRGGAGARRAPDRGLVDPHHLVDGLRALQGLVAARLRGRAVQAAGQLAVEDVLHQRGLAGPADPGDRRQHAQGERHVQVPQVVLAGSLHLEPCPAARRRVAGSGMRSSRRR